MSDQTQSEIGYAAALAELNDILADLDDDSLDIDVLGDKVERAALLIAACRERIDVARLRVDQIVAGLDSGSENTNGVTEGDAGDDV